MNWRKLKYNLKLSEDEKSRELLRNIRDLSLNKPYSVGLLLAEVFRLVLLSVTALSLTVLNEWVSSREASKVKAVSLLLRSIPQTFAFTQVRFLGNLLEQAYELGNECYEATINNLFDALMTDSRRGTVGQPRQKDIDIRDQSLAIASQFLIGSPAHKFYISLAKYSEANPARQIALGEAQME